MSHVCSAALQLKNHKRNFRNRAPSWLLAVALSLSLGVGSSQTLPDGVSEVPFVCPPRERDADDEPPVTEEEIQEAARRAAYREVFPAYLSVVPEEPDTTLFMPVEGIRVRDVVDTWGAARSEGRSHEGTDIFAAQGTPIYSATPGYIYRIGPARRGGQTVTVVGGAGRRYYYAHLSAYADDIREGQKVTTDTLLGYVGDTGNAITTPYHLHFGVYASEGDVCDWDALNPYPFLVDR